MLTINYLSEIHEIQISLIEEDNYWPKIRNAIIENAEETISTGPNSIRLPVWSFLSCRQEIAFLINKYKIPFEADENVTKILHQALDHEHDYQKAIEQLPLDENELLEKLKKENFIRILTKEQTRNVRKLGSLPAGATFSVPGAGNNRSSCIFFVKNHPVSNY